VDDLDTPNCPKCLISMEGADVGQNVTWLCPECGLVRL
jgi:tRNA(Ile2) C34 agmatinyltransferase TiaS